MGETIVRMGELAVAKGAGDVLACIGLGSCIGLVLADRTSDVVAMAHVMLPSSSADITQPGKFADTAIPAMLHAVAQAGVRTPRMEAALVGGAAMFALNTGQDIGNRNAEAVLAALAKHRIPVLAQATGGNRGRTVRVVRTAPGKPPTLTVREAGSSDEDLPFGRGAGLRVAA